VTVLVDADNVFPTRLQPVLDLLGTVMDTAATRVRIIAAGHSRAMRRLTWPAGAELHDAQGWQQADLVLAQEYVPDARALILITGDGDFGLLASRHPGPVLVVSGSPSSRLRDVGTVVDPAVEGTEPIRAWLAAVATP
jgi:hypothetical protein